MTTLDVDIVGLKALTDRLIALGADADDVIEGAIFDLANETRNLAVAGISGGEKTGTTYYRIPGEKYMTIRAGSTDGPPVAFIPGGGAHNLSPKHTASAPGQYPATDTGRLVGSVKAIISGTTAIVGTDVKYGAWLELGTSSMAARPWLLPSFKAAIIGLEKGLKAAIEARVK